LKKKKIWGIEHKSIDSVKTVFVDYIKGNIKQLPWYDNPIQLETTQIQDQLIKINMNGCLTINSQPKVNGAKSNDKSVGWGGIGGYIYQKA